MLLSLLSTVVNNYIRTKQTTCSRNKCNQRTAQNNLKDENWLIKTDLNFLRLTATDITMKTDQSGFTKHTSNNSSRDYNDDFRSGYRNVILYYPPQPFSGLVFPRRSDYMIKTSCIKQVRNLLQN